ncbi:hypothetical protein D3C76_1045040 [compost metagenome]
MRTAGMQAFEMALVKARGTAGEVNRAGRVTACAVPVFERTTYVALAVGTVAECPAVGVQIIRRLVGGTRGERGAVTQFCHPCFGGHHDRQLLREHRPDSFELVSGHDRRLVG